MQYRRIAVLAGARSTTGRDRQAGYLQALQARGLAPLTCWLQPTVDSGRTATQDLLNAETPPDAVLATNGLLLLGAAQAVQSAGLRMPDDIGLAGFDNNDWTTLPAVDVTVVEQPTYDIGRTAAELLLQRLNEPARPARCVVLEGRLVVRGSTRRAAAEATA